MSLIENVNLRNRFQRAVRIDHDFNDPQAIDGFYCSLSSVRILSSMADHISTNSQCAFTWTGPYGSGKSSLAVFLSALLSGDSHLQNRAFASLEPNTARHIRNQFGELNWQVIPVVGRRENPIDVIGESIESLKIDDFTLNQPWSETHVVAFIKKLIEFNSKMSIGTILFVDEMGKFLESAADEMTDLYLFQQLAEIACRSNGHFILIGALHQAFSEYAKKLNQTSRDEWEKIQGRFVDLTFKVSIDEQIDMLSQAIRSEHQSKKPGKSSKTIAKTVTLNRSINSEELAVNLEKCWPLHPAVACLLGPMSQSRFGQNQRSVFSFLSSRESHGFQEFIRMDDENKLYCLWNFWEYLRSNLESSIYASSDGHRWALAAESVDRCEAQGSNAVEIKLLKTIAVLDFFRNRSSLVANFEVLCACMLGYSSSTVRNALSNLKSKSLVVYRKFVGGYSIFAGSDFDIDKAVAVTRSDITDVDYAELKTLAELQPILAKRHFHECGALRWCDIVFAPLDELSEYVRSVNQTNNTAGLFVVAVPTRNEDQKTSTELCREAGRLAENNDVVVGLSRHSWKVADLYKDLLALQRVNDERPELASDRVARMEIQSRLSSLQVKLADELNRTIDNAMWYLKHHKPKRLQQSDLCTLASKLAGRKFNQSPKIHVEILNRNKPSTNAVAAQNALLKRMLENNGDERLGIEGYPAEYSFFSSLLEQTGLYKKVEGKWGFHLPSSPRGVERKFRLTQMFSVAHDYLKSAQYNMVELTQIYDIWRNPPYGVKDGLMPIFIVAFILARLNQIAFYRDRIFQVNIKTIDAEYLVKHPENTSIRLIENTPASSRMLAKLANIAEQFSDGPKISDRTPINVARGLVSIFETLPQWTIRTNTLSSNANKVRNLLKQANDPNQLLFDDLLKLFAVGKRNSISVSDETASKLRRGIRELVEAYPKMIRRLRRNLLKELQVKNTSEQSFRILRERACNIAQVSGDFRLEAFIGRLAKIQNSIADIEGLASLAVGRLPNLWGDSDYDRANLELAKLARDFIQIETFANLKGRKNKRHVGAILFNTEDSSSSIIQKFHIADSELDDVNELVAHLSESLNGKSNVDKNIVLAALAKVCIEYVKN